MLWYESRHFRGDSMTQQSEAVIDHYKRSNLMERITLALTNAGHDPENLTVEILSELDHLHGGGFTTTEVQVDLAGIPKGSHVLDAGCGIGGPSRYLAKSHACTVEAVDLTPEFVQVAGELNERVGLGDRISLRTGSVTELPYDDQSFDVVLCQNVSMNVADKAAMFSEAFRVLRPGGIYTFSHLAEGPNGSPIYPLPWAMSPEVSFLETPAAILERLATAGFIDVQDKVDSARSKPGDGPLPGTIGAAPAMGDDMPVRTGNSARSLQEGRLVSMMVVARRPD